MYRTNFHEDSLRHFLLKAANARDDGHPVGAKPTKYASKATMLELYNAENTPAEIKKRLAIYVGDASPTIDSDLFISRFDPETQKKLRALLGK